MNDLKIGIWKSIYRRLLSSNDSKNCSKRYIDKIIEKHYIQGQEFKGILRYLSDESGGNIHDKGVVEITPNSAPTEKDSNVKMDLNVIRKFLKFFKIFDLFLIFL